MGAAPRVNVWGTNFQALFKFDSIVIDNIIFKLHHQMSFFILLVGVLFVFFENYLDGKAIVCRDKNDFTDKYCWLHGTGYIDHALSDELRKAGGRNCFVNQDNLSRDKNPRVTSYYIWIPFVLVICMGLAKIPRVLWKNFLEGNLMVNLCLRPADGGSSLSPEKIAQNFLAKRGKFTLYLISYTLCEVLNIVTVFLSLHILHALFNHEYLTYGLDYFEYLRNEMHGQDPMCNIFPTEVSCSVLTGGATGGFDTINTICILSNNLFNMYYFLILWWWWILLVSISFTGLIYRISVAVLPAGNWLAQMGQPMSNIPSLRLSPAARFVLSRLARNLPEYDMEEVIRELTHLLLPDCRLTKEGQETIPMLDANSV